MLENERPELIEAICGSAGKKFDRTSCLYYAHVPAKQCRLLKELRMEGFWEQCRGAYFILYEAVQVWSKRFQARYPGLPIDEAEDFDFQGVIRRLQKQKVDVENLAAWYKYVNKTVYLEIKKTLIQRGLIPEKRNCGSCKYLSESKPYVCIKTGKAGKKTDPPCKAYSLNIAYFMSIDEESSSGNGHNQQPPDRLFLEVMTTKNHEVKTPETLILAKEEKERSALAAILAMLAQRPDKEKPGSKKGKKYQRHYTVFSNIISLLAKGIPKEAAVKNLAKKMSVNEKTIRRDIAEIKHFLREKHALEWLQ